MILYNVTINIDINIEEDWKNWMRTIHIPEVLATACFTEARLSRIQGEEEGGCTYSVMYLSPSNSHYEKYQTEHAPNLQKEHTERYQGKFAAFRTVLEVVEEFKL